MKKPKENSESTKLIEPVDRNLWLFVYDSNMNLASLTYWFNRHLQDGKFPFSEYGVISACRARLPGYKLVWNHRRKDDTGAVNVQKGNQLTDEVFGVALLVPESILKAIDIKQGFDELNTADSAYLRAPETFYLEDDSNRKIHGFLYVAAKTEPIDVSPLHVYKDPILNGARLFSLPKEYILAIESVPSVNPSDLASAPTIVSELATNPTSSYPVDLESAPDPSFAALETFIATATNSHFKDLASIFLKNLQAAFGLVMLPYHFLTRAETLRISTQIESADSFNAIDHITYMGFPMPPEQRGQALHDRLKSAFEQQVVIDEVTKRSHAEWQQLLLSDEMMEDFAFRLLSASISFTWTSFESMSRDLWIASVNLYPEKFASRCGADKQISIGDLAKNRFDIKTCMGDILVHKCDFSNLKQIASSFAMIVGEKFRSTEDQLKNDRNLFLTEKRRHLLQHKAGVIDQKYLEESKQALTIGSKLHLTYQDAVDGIQAAVNSGSAIFRFLDAFSSLP